MAARTRSCGVGRQPAPPLIAGGPMVLEPYHLDLMWEWFFATGAKEPVLLIVDKFSLNPQDPGDVELPPVPNRQGVDRPRSAAASIGRTAVWSAASLASGTTNSWSTSVQSAPTRVYRRAESCGSTA